MRLELNMASVEVLREFAAQLEQVGVDCVESGETLFEECAALMEGMGVHKEDFEDMLTNIGRSINNFTETVWLLTPQMRACANNIEAFINQSDSSDDVPRAMGTRVRTLRSYASFQGKNKGGNETGVADLLFRRHTVHPESYGIPRDLAHSMQQMKSRADGGKIYNSPEETGKYLDYNQGKKAGYDGTCGLCSCENLLRLAGINISEEDVVQYAIENHLCVSGRTDDENGGTNFADRQKILAAFGIKSTMQSQNINSIAQAVTEGKGVIISVDAGRLWNDSRYLNGLHAVTVTSVERDASGKIDKFHICDSGYKQYDMVVTAEYLQKALARNRMMNVTQQIIR